MKLYRFSGPQGTARKYGPNKGVMRAYRELKRQEAEERQKLYRAKALVANAALQDQHDCLIDNSTGNMLLYGLSGLPSIRPSVYST